jgi:hypothetical protein
MRITAPRLDSNLTNIDDINTTTAFKVAFAGFLRLSEFTYTKAEASKPALFLETKLSRRDVQFFNNDEYATILLRRSKSDYKHKGVTIVLTATKDSTCAVTALRHLFDKDPRPKSTPLFRLVSGSFSRSEILKELSDRTTHAGLSPEGYLGHSFRKGAAQEAHNNGLTQAEIQILGRWSSGAVQRYFKINRRRVIQLNRQFQTGAI